MVRCDWLKTKTHKLHRDPKNTAAKISLSKVRNFPRVELGYTERSRRGFANDDSSNCR